MEINFFLPYFDKQRKMGAHFFHRQEIFLESALGVAVDIVGSISFALFLFLLFNVHTFFCVETKKKFESGTPKIQVIF